MSDRDRDDDAKENLKQGLGLLWRAARKTAGGLRKDLERTNVGRALDDAGRELLRATTNVVGRIGSELKNMQGPDARHQQEPDPEHPPDGGAPLHERNKPTGPTPEDPGFRIALDDEPGEGGGRGQDPHRGGEGPERGSGGPERGGEGQG